MQMNIFLIGYRCTGKSSVGKLLAEKLEWPFLDSDAEIVSEAEMTISDMIAEHGWNFFREKEQIVISRLCASDSHVIATGGGVILNPENVKNIKQHGVVVWLRAGSETIRRRIAKDEMTKSLRPSLTSKGLMEEIEEVLMIRMPLYESASDFCIDTDFLTPDEICDAIISRGQGGNLSGFSNFSIY